LGFAKKSTNSQFHKPSQNQESTLNFLFGGLGFGAQRINRPTSPSQHPNHPKANNVWENREPEKSKNGTIIYV
jgi:hypothetical protein